MTRVLFAMLFVCSIVAAYESWRNDRPAVIDTLSARELRGGANCQLPYNSGVECEKCDTDNRKCDSSGSIWICYNSNPMPCVACTSTAGASCGGSLRRYAYLPCQGESSIVGACPRVTNNASSSACDPDNTLCY